MSCIVIHMDNNEPIETCEFSPNNRRIECCGNNEVRRINGKLITICDAHFYNLVDASMSLW